MCAAIRLLDADPDLGEALALEDRAAVARILVVPAFALEVGAWDPAAQLGAARPAVGLLLLEGVLTRDIVFARRSTTELLGAGDVLRPWDDDVPFDPLPFRASWRVQLPARMAVLDARVAAAAGRWPALAGALAARQVRRARGLAFQRAIAQLPRVEDRVLVLLWALAERWGRVGPTGVRLRLDLPHRVLATLVGARRPSVTSGLTALARAGLVERAPGGWILHGDPAVVLAQRLDGADHALTI
jgi:CRP/FNR family cyclic AMP-dependent transcriptional regulator